MATRCGPFSTHHCSGSDGVGASENSPIDVVTSISRDSPPNETAWQGQGTRHRRLGTISILGTLCRIFWMDTCRGEGGRLVDRHVQALCHLSDQAVQTLRRLSEQA
eukprot:366402-Chlamydomonas_euryale.AAC.15